MTIDNRKPSPAPSKEENFEAWHKEHCWEISDISLRNINKAIAQERERYENQMDEVNRYEALFRLRESFINLSGLIDDEDMLQYARQELHQLIAKGIVLLQDSDL